MTAPTTFVDAATVASRVSDYPVDTDFSGGMNNGGCAPGIGINVGVANVSADDFTLLDQDEDARTPQVGQYIGGDGLGEGQTGKGTVGIIVVTNDADGEGGITDTGDATLTTLSTGWVATP